MINLIFLLPLLIASNVFAAKQIVITVDDLPGWGLPAGTNPNFLDLIGDALVKEQVPATGFVIGKLASQSSDHALTLERWASKGLPLANHTWDHVKYSSQTVQEFLVGVERTENILLPIRKKYGPWPLAFRFPMLNQGNTLEQEVAANKYFQDTKTLLAHVSVDTSDWAFAQYYSQFLLQDPSKLKKLEDLYLQHIFDCLDWAEKASDHLFSKQIPQIILLHSNSLNGKLMGAILDGLKQRGYTFIGLEKALNDKVYASYKYKIIYQPADHFYFHMSNILNKPLPSGRDRSSYQYFKDYWEPKIKAL
ncbi:MAG: polysaccharide deacetylase family protein [Bdellovibrionales bacterium]|nr:polysaccharide deacetylase family protein [Bdellovibrionales bacterium]